jgi:hypothetical protein
MIIIAFCAIVALTWTFLVFMAKAEHTKYLESRGAENILREQYKVSEAKLAAENSALHASNVKAEAEKQKALADKAQEQRARQKAEAERDAEKAKTATLPDNELSGAINLRIGAGQSRPMAAGVFTFLRPGTEKTLNLFIDGETAARNYESAKVEIKKTEDAFNDSELQRKNGLAEIASKDDLLKKATDGWAEADRGKRLLERSILGIKIKTFIIGVGFGGGTVFGLHLAGVIK